MKRSEMIDIISGVLKWNLDIDDISISEQILKQIEDAGMLPPAFLSVSHNAWESEDA